MKQRVASLRTGTRGTLAMLLLALLVLALLAPAAPAHAETEPPSVPTGLVATEVTQTSVALAWNASTDNVGVAGYRLYEYVRVNPQFSHWVLRTNNITTTSTTVTGLDPGSIHRYAVTAFDAANNVSARSATLEIRTLQPPLAYHNGNGSIHAIVGELFSYDVDAIGVPEPSFSLVAGPSGMSVNPVSGIVEWTPAAGDEGTASATVRATNSEGSDDHTFSFPIYPAGTDLEPPSSVSHPLATNITWNGCTLTWNAATDNVGVAGYMIRAQRDSHGQSLFTVATSIGSATTYTITNLAPGAGYRIWVAAYDAAGNVATISGVPPAHITTSPFEPANPQTLAYQIDVEIRYDALDGGVTRPNTSVWGMPQGVELPSGILELAIDGSGAVSGASPTGGDGEPGTLHGQILYNPQSYTFGLSGGAWGTPVGNIAPLVSGTVDLQDTFLGDFAGVGAISGFIEDGNSGDNFDLSNGLGPNGRLEWTVSDPDGLALRFTAMGTNNGSGAGMYEFVLEGDGLTYDNGTTTAVVGTSGVAPIFVAIDPTSRTFSVPSGTALNNHLNEYWELGGGIDNFTGAIDSTGQFSGTVHFAGVEFTSLSGDGDGMFTDGNSEGFDRGNSLVPGEMFNATFTDSSGRFELVITGTLIAPARRIFLPLIRWNN